LVDRIRIPPSPKVEKLKRNALEMGREKESLHTVLDMLVQPDQLEALGLSSLER